MDYKLYKEKIEVEKNKKDSKFKEPFEKFINGKEKTLLINCSSEAEYRACYAYFYAKKRHSNYDFVICHGKGWSMYTIKA